LERSHAAAPLTGRLDADADSVLAETGPLLAYAQASGPRALAEAARERLEEPYATARARLLVYWNGGLSSGDDYLSRATLRPYVELLRSLSLTPDRVHRESRCPFCGGLPWIGVRREGSQMEGARRLLGCALCGLEWLFPRILCASCGEEDPHKLPAFQVDRYPAVRIEACETCRRYVKSIDLSLDARPIPEVDDLLSLSMDLWAGEEGWTRLEPGLAGV
jgi:formate dehydrogenase accessory protein FdhE